MIGWGLPFILVVVCLLILVSLIAWNQPRALLRSAQYDEFLPNAGGNADRFFALVYERLQSDLTGSRLPFSAVGFGPRPLFAGRHIFSARPVYLEVRYEHLSYFLYATPAPGGLHVSTWLFSKHELWQGHPILKWLVAWRQAQMTLFQFDVMRLFHSVVEGAVHQVMDELRAEQGLRPLEAYERRPVLSGFYAAMRLAALGAGNLSAGELTFGGVAPGSVAPVGLAPVGAAPLGLTENSLPGGSVAGSAPDSAVSGGSTPASPVLPLSRRVVLSAETTVALPGSSAPGAASPLNVPGLEGEPAGA